MEIIVENLCKICKYTEFDRAAFKEMLGVCFSQDYKIELTETQLEDLCKQVIQQVDAAIQILDLLVVNGAAKGFILYQKDSPDSDWCERETWGFIRELFVAADCRKNGYGRKLVKSAENKLNELEVPNIYLTTDDSKDFWTKMGYRDSGEICNRNSGSIFVK